MNLFGIAVKRLDGQPASLAEYRGQVLLIVNVASKCGLTPQYTGLGTVYDRFEAKGLQVLAFPCNDFGAQEPGSAEEIQSFCERNYGVRFPVFSKIHVNGDERHPLYAQLISGQPAATPSGNGQLAEALGKHGLLPKHATDVMWNFEKFLIGRDGTVLARFAPDVEPEAPALVAAIEAALG